MSASSFISNTFIFLLVLKISVTLHVATLLFEAGYFFFFLYEMEDYIFFNKTKCVTKNVEFPLYSCKFFNQ